MGACARVFSKLQLVYHVSGLVDDLPKDSTGRAELMKVLVDFQSDRAFSGKFTSPEGQCPDAW